MKRDEDKTQKQLIKELKSLRQRLIELEESEIERVAEVIRESEERYRRLADMSPDAIVVHRDGEFVFINTEAARLFGAATPQELVGKPVSDVIRQDDRGDAQERFRQITEEKATFARSERKVVRLDGTTIDVEVTGIPFTYQGKPAVQGVVRDITERKRVDEWLRLQSTALESAANAIVITDREGRITWVNPAFTRLTGYTSDEVLGQNPRLVKSGRHEPALPMRSTTR